MNETPEEMGYLRRVLYLASNIYLSSAGNSFFGSGIAYGIVSGPYNLSISAVFHPPNGRHLIDTEPVYKAAFDAAFDVKDESTVAPNIEVIDQEDKRLKGLFDDKPKRSGEVR